MEGRNLACFAGLERQSDSQKNGAAGKGRNSLGRQQLWPYPQRCGKINASSISARALWSDAMTSNRSLTDSMP